MKQGLLSIFILFTILFSANAQNRIKVVLDQNLKGSYTGKLLVYTLKDTSKQFGNNTSEEDAAFTMEVSNWKYGEIKELPQHGNSLNVKLKDLAPGVYKLIAVLDTNTHERGRFAPGNLFSRNEALLEVRAGQENTVEIVLSHAFPVRGFLQNDSIREITVASPLLSRFRKMPVEMKAAVVLPAGFQKEPDRIYPVVYIIPGWGGTHHQALAAGARKAYGIGTGTDKIYVFLNPESQTPFGLHGFVDSRVNGPWGKALIEELMPFVQKNFRGSADPRLNFLTGQSTGGYSVVWLALNYPGMFGGAWSTSPDPLDFSNFIGVNLYKDENYYTGTNGDERGFNKVNGSFVSTLRKTCLLESFEGDGGQQQSFAAEFGKPAKDGRPVNVFDVQTGKINKVVLSTWKKYDMTLYVLSHAGKLKKLMKGPVHIFAGSADNFLLNSSALSFAEKIKNIGLPIRVEEIPGADHFRVRNNSVTETIQMEIDKQIAVVKGKQE